MGSSSHARGLHITATPNTTIASPRPASPLLAAITIRPGNVRDYDALARFHYIPGRPAAFAGVLRAEIEQGVFIARWTPPIADADARAEQVQRNPILLGVLAVSMPVLDSRLRPLAWPGRYRTADRHADMLRVNRELRTISRVIIDPRVRGIGLATRLVRQYLTEPLTPATEAIAAMGGCCPFFSAAGMTPYELPLARHELRLIDALAWFGVTPIDVLTDPARCASLLCRPLMQRELTRFMQGNPKRRQGHLSRGEALLAACASLCSPRVAYAHCKENNQ